MWIIEYLFFKFTPSDEARYELQMSQYGERQPIIACHDVESFYKRGAPISRSRTLGKIVDQCAVDIHVVA